VSLALDRWYGIPVELNGSLACFMADRMLQGLGIALVAARAAGVPVKVLDNSQKSLDKGLAFAGIV
jgi:hypothetical protein